MAFSVNWNRGLHRLFFVATGAWIVFLFGVLPWQAATKYRYLADIARKQGRLPDHFSFIHDEADIFYQLWLHASSPYLWLAAVLVPVLVYLLIRALIRLVLWLAQGFTGSKAA